MKTLKTNLTEYKVICHMARQQHCKTGKPVPVQGEHKKGGVMVTAPVEFLQALGF